MKNIELTHMIVDNFVKAYNEYEADGKSSCTVEVHCTSHKMAATRANDIARHAKKLSMLFLLYNGKAENLTEKDMWDSEVYHPRLEKAWKTFEESMENYKVMKDAVEIVGNAIGNIFHPQVFGVGDNTYISENSEENYVSCWIPVGRTGYGVHILFYFTELTNTGRKNAVYGLSEALVNVRKHLGTINTTGIPVYGAFDHYTEKNLKKLITLAEDTIAGKHNDELVITAKQIACLEKMISDPKRCGHLGWDASKISQLNKWQASELLSYFFSADCSGVTYEEFIAHYDKYLKA